MAFRKITETIASKVPDKLKLHRRHESPKPAQSPAPEPNTTEEIATPRRSLSRPIASLSTEGMQTESLLFGTLPPEIRHRIFELVLGGHELHLELADDGHVQIPSSAESREEVVAERLLALALCCRLGYMECLPYLFTHNAFHTADVDLISSLPRVLPSKHMHSITSLVFVWPCHAPSPIPALTAQDAETRSRNETWDTVWATLASLQSLQKLKVEIDVPLEWADSWRANDGMLLESIRDAGTWKVPRFELVVSWEQSRIYEEIERKPFELVRRPGSTPRE